MLFPLIFNGLASCEAKTPAFGACESAARGALPVIVLFLSACATPAPEIQTGAASCPDPRPQICTTIYAPVCAEHSDGRTETHASACNACADDTVVDFSEGACEDTDT